MKRILTILTLVILCLALGGVAGADMVFNGDFETGDFSGWTTSGNFQYTTVTTAAAHSGNYGVEAGPVTNLGYISQDLTTAAGQSYAISFWLRSNGNTPNQFMVDWGSDTIFSQVNIPSQAYTQYNFTKVASGSSTTLRLGFRNDPSYLYFDDISVNAVPLPPAALLLGSGLLGLLGFRRLRK